MWYVVAGAMCSRKGIAWEGVSSWIYGVSGDLYHKGIVSTRRREEDDDKSSLLPRCPEAEAQAGSSTQAPTNGVKWLAESSVSGPPNVGRPGHLQREGR